MFLDWWRWMMKSIKFPRLVKPSTIAFTREARKIPGYTFFDWLHGMVYMKYPYLYIGIGVGEHPVTRWVAPIATWIGKLFGEGKFFGENEDAKPVTLADTYHGKVVPLEAAKQLVSVKEPINLPNLEHIIPFEIARDLIMQNPDHIAVLECPCRSARENPCLPLDVCLIIGEPFAGLVMDHHPERARWINSTEAVQILSEEDERGHVHHAFFKDAVLGRFYAICNCCSCCCGAMQAHQNGTPMLISSGYLAQVDEILCIGCETCTDYCQFSALSIRDFTSYIDEDLCMGCGVCVSKCDQGALSLRRAPEKGEPLELCELMAQVVDLEFEPALSV